MLQLKEIPQLELVDHAINNARRLNRQPIIGIVVADQESGRMENVGALVRLGAVTHTGVCGAVLAGEAVGRFKVQRLRRMKPYVVAKTRDVHDVLPADADAEAAAGVIEERVWQRAREARELANELYGHLRAADPYGDDPEGDEMLDLSQTSKWRPSATLLEPSVLNAAAAEADSAAAAAGECEVVWGGHDTDYTLECEARRRQRFSFALARALQLDADMEQLVLRGTSTTQRLRWLEHHLDEGLGYLRARRSLRSALSEE